MPTTEDERDELVTKGLPRLIVLIGLIVILGVWGSFFSVVVVLALVVMIFLHELGHYLTAKAAGMKVTEFFLGFGPRIWSFRRGETEYGIKAIPAGAYVRIIGMSNLEEVDPADEDRTYRAKPYWRRMSVAVAGSTMHFILAFLLVYAALVGFGKQEADRWVVDEVSGPAAEAGLLPGDDIVAIDGRAVIEFDDVAGYVQDHGGEEVAVTVDRSGREVTLQAELAEQNPVSGEEQGFLGVRVTYPRQPSHPVAALGESVKQTGAAAWQSVIGIGRLFSPDGLEGYVEHLRADKDADIEKRPTSVVGIVQAGSQVAEDGIVYVLGLLFAVNVFIGVFNLTPLLPFDGGHVAIATYEQVRSMISGRRHRADVAKLLPLTYLVVLALALLFVTTLYLDISSPLKLE